MIYNTAIYDGQYLTYTNKGGRTGAVGDELVSPNKEHTLKFDPKNNIYLYNKGVLIWDLKKATGKSWSEDFASSQSNVFELKKDRLRLRKIGIGNLPDIILWEYKFDGIDQNSRKRLRIDDTGNLFLETETAGQWKNFWQLKPDSVKTDKNSIVLPLLIGSAVLYYTYFRK